MLLAFACERYAHAGLFVPSSGALSGNVINKMTYYNSIGRQIALSFPLKGGNLLCEKKPFVVVLTSDEAH